jgi:hypothetical protein
MIIHNHLGSDPNSLTLKPIKPLACVEQKVARTVRAGCGSLQFVQRTLLISKALIVVASAEGSFLAFSPPAKHRSASHPLKVHRASQQEESAIPDISSPAGCGW